MGIITIKKNATTVCQYTLTGEFVGEYPSIQQASCATGVNPASIHSALWMKMDHISHGYIWLKKGHDVNAVIQCNNEEAERKRNERILAMRRSRIKSIGGKSKKLPDVDWKVERQGDYIFIEKETLSGADLCMRCALNANGKCLPCRKDERPDGKQGYWRYCKSIPI